MCHIRFENWKGRKGGDICRIPQVSTGSSVNYKGLKNEKKNYSSNFSFDYAFGGF